jgi:predicted AAA+ superfamily ATPase
VQGVAPDPRTRVLQDYVHVVLLRDVVERHRVTNVDALRRLVRHLLSTPGGKFSVHRSHRDLRAAGVSVGKDTLHEYLGHLEDAFLLFAVEIASDSPHVRAVNPRKCYPVDVGLSRATSFRASADTGRMLETLVYLELRRRGLHASYVVTESGREVDFLVRRPDGDADLVQVCCELSDAETRARELAGLDEALREGRAKSATIVTLHDEETVAVAGRRVRVVPAWRWFLEDGASRKGWDRVS